MRVNLDLVRTIIYHSAYFVREPRWALLRLNSETRRPRAAQTASGNRSRLVAAHCASLARAQASPRRPLFYARQKMPSMVCSLPNAVRLRGAKSRSCLQQELLGPVSRVEHSFYRLG